MKRVLRLFALVLAAVALLSVPSAQGKYFDHFGFGLGNITASNQTGDALGLNNAVPAAGDVNTNSQKGFDIVYSANHLFEYKGTSYSSGTEQRLTNLRTGYYGFVIRGGDGGVGRMGDLFALITAGSLQGTPNTIHKP